MGMNVDTAHELRSAKSNITKPYNTMFHMKLQPQRRRDPISRQGPNHRGDGDKIAEGKFQIAIADKDQKPDDASQGREYEQEGHVHKAEESR